MIWKGRVTGDCACDCGGQSIQAGTVVYVENRTHLIHVYCSHRCAVVGVSP